MTNNELERWMSSKEAASRMGISPSTFKRLCDAHDIPVIRTPGGHRRIDSAHFEMVSRLMHGRGNNEDNCNVNTDLVFSLLLTANHLQLIDRLYRAAPTLPSQVKLIEDVFVPALWRVGEQWQKKNLSIAQEKICTYTASMALDGLTARFSTQSKTRLTFIGASFAPSQDTLASKIVALGLSSINIRPIFLGSGIAPAHIAEVAILTNADAVWITHTHVMDLEKVVHDHKILRELLPQGTRVIIGGGGLSPSARRLIDDCTYHDSILAWMEHENTLGVRNSVDVE